MNTRMATGKKEKIKLTEINSYLTCYLCKGYLIDATTISECLHSFCRSCIIKFLQENCYCPVCEVIINKAKPCLKLDKTLQDIVYKLVPELFVKEMIRRRKFYQGRPSLALKVAPEERGEDTERTIFNPQDAISLSIEYVSDDSSPGAIAMLASQKLNSNQLEQDLTTQDNPMKRYLQCPGMLRIEVLKKFVQNKYNVDTNKFHIDILYKRVPLPDHYTLIDIGYIYSWKRNEPMKFFFRITDINRVAERFDYFDSKAKPNSNLLVFKPTPKSVKLDKERKKKAEIVYKNGLTKPSQNGLKLCSEKEGEKKTKLNLPTTKTKKCAKSDSDNKINFKSKSVSFGHNNNNNNKSVDNKSVDKKTEVIKTELAEEIQKLKNEKDLQSLYICRKEEITKIQKVSNKEGHPIGFNITNTPVRMHNIHVLSKEKTLQKTVDKDEDLEKSKFLESVELTSIKKVSKSLTPSSPSKPSTSSSGQKRKNSSPHKTEKKRISPKISPPPFKHIVSNGNPIINNSPQLPSPPSVLAKSPMPKNCTKDIQNFIDNCKIPSSLSITLNESSERTPPQIPPVKNYIEILKLPDSDQENKKDDACLLSPKSPQTFQKIFEESIKKESPTKEKEEKANQNNSSNNDNTDSTDNTNKRKILAIASQLQKKIKPEQEKKVEEKVAIPRLKPPPSTKMHSPTLGLNYTVSVTEGKTSPKAVATPLLNNKDKKVYQPPSPSTSSKFCSTQKINQTNQLLEKYNIQNLAQLTASFNLGFGGATGGQYSALQHAMLLKHIERQNWLNLNQGPLLQYEKYLQSLNGAQKLGNIKEN